MKKKKYQILDLFAGCGGLSQGFLNIGDFEVPFANEFWEPAQMAYEYSHPKTRLLKEDIRELTNLQIKKEMKKKEIEKIDLIIGGPPCQGFSMAGARRKDDPRNTLFLEFVRLVSFLKPKFFIFENVKGLTTMLNENGKFVLDEVITEFENIGYTIQYKVLNAADYGVPQKRERVIIIGSKSKKIKNILHPKPTHYPNNLKELKQWIKRNAKYFFDIDESIIRKSLKVKDINDTPKEILKILNKLSVWTKALDVLDDLENKKDLNDNFNHKPMNHTDIVVKRMSMIEEGKNIPTDQSHWPKELRRKKFASVYKRIHRDEPTTTMVPGHSAFPIHYKHHRALTVREAARIQTLPDNFKFFGSKTNQCLVVGNAVPTTMAEAIAKEIKKELIKN